MGFIIALLFIVLGWLGLGSILLNRGTRPREAGGLRRKVSNAVVAVGDEVEVELEMTPPVELGEIEDRDLLLVIDHSGSMGSGPASDMGRAISAAEKFLERCPDQVRVGLVTFNHRADRRCPLGSAESARSSLETLSASGGTSISEGLLASAAELVENMRPNVQAVVLVLSDGFDDPAVAKAAALNLRRKVPGVDICAAALGAGVDRAVLTEIAGGQEHVFPVDSTEDFDALFTFLAHRLAGSVALAARADEAIRSPQPFTWLGATPAATRVALETSEMPTASLLWKLPVFDSQPIRLSYRLRVECPGWHSVASRLETVWTMPDGSSRVEKLTGGPRVLALPPILAGAWPVLHPLIFMLSGNRFCSAVHPPKDEQVECVAPPDPPHLPTALAPVERQPFEPDLRPSLTIGLGAPGEAALCRLRHRLEDRGLAEGAVRCRWLGLGGCPEPDSFGGLNLRPGERRQLDIDLFPYLDELRRGGVPALRAWVPWQEWLAEAGSQSRHYLLDRRRSRLALLERSERLEELLSTVLAEIVAQEGNVVIAGCMDDPVASGLVGEVAHRCAVAGAKITILLAEGQEKRKADRAALQKELHRFILLRGDETQSDRVSPPALARRLVDRLIVLPATSAEGGAAQSMAEMLYAMLVFPSVDTQIPTARIEVGQTLVTRAYLEAVALPMEHLWKWVRDRALAQTFAADLLQWNSELEGAREVDEEECAQWVERFWSAEGTNAPAPLLVGLGAQILAGSSVESVLLGRLPSEAPPNRQVTFHRSERQRLVSYSRDWSVRRVAHSRNQRDLGLCALVTSLRRLADDYREIFVRLETLSAHPTLSDLGRLGIGFYRDQLLLIEDLLEQAIQHRARWVGSRRSVASRLFESYRQAEIALGATSRLQDLWHRAELWADEYGAMTRERVALTLQCRASGDRLLLAVRIGDRILTAGEDPADILRRELERYRGTVHEGWLGEPASMIRSEPRGGLGVQGRIGGLCEQVFPGGQPALDTTDPAYAGLLTLDSLPLEEALGVIEYSDVDLPFVWPEEAHAQRLGGWLRRKPIQREPVEWPPQVVQLLRSPRKLLAFLTLLAKGSISDTGDQWGIRIADRWEILAERSLDIQPEEALRIFESVARNVLRNPSVVATDLLDEDLLAVWSSDPLTALEQIETHPLARPAVPAHGWGAWKDVIQALTLERSPR